MRRRTRCLTYQTGIVAERDVTLCGRHDEHMVPADTYPPTKRPQGVCQRCFAVYRMEMKHNPPVKNYEWRGETFPVAVDDAGTAPQALYSVVVDAASHPAVARLVDATQTLLDVVAANRLVIGEYIGPSFVKRIEDNAKAAIRGVRCVR